MQPNLNVDTPKAIRDCLRSATYAYGKKTATVLAFYVKWLNSQAVDGAFYAREPQGAPIILPNAASELPGVLRRAAESFRHTAETVSRTAEFRCAWHGAANILFDAADELEKKPGQFAAFGR